MDYLGKWIPIVERERIDCICPSPTHAGRLITSNGGDILYAVGADACNVQSVVLPGDVRLCRYVADNEGGDKLRERIAELERLVEQHSQQRHDAYEVLRDLQQAKWEDGINGRLWNEAWQRGHVVTARAEGRLWGTAHKL